MKAAACLLLAGATIAGLFPSRAAETKAVAASDFLDSIGTQSAISRRGETFGKTVECVKYLGVRWMRSGIEGDVPMEELRKLHDETGVRFSWGFGSGNADLPKLLATAHEVAAMGALLSFEGPNEPNNWGIKYRGQSGGRDGTWLPVAELQRDLYAAVKSDPALKACPVWSISEEGAESDNVGLQFLTIPEGAGTLLPAGTHFADCANVHNYIYHPNASGLEENKTWKAADPSAACKVDGLYGEYGVTWRKHFQGNAGEALERLPRVTTETGATVGDGVTEEIHGLNLLTLYLDQFKRGWNHTANYLMRDRSDEGGNQKFGFYAPDYTPRKAAVYLHNLTTILRDDGTASANGNVNYSVSPEPETAHDLLLEKSDGEFELLVWDERLGSKSDDVRVQLGKTYRGVKVYDPTVGPEATQSLGAVDAASLTLSNHPVVIELPAN
jgi:hypothetical protein